MQNDFWRLQQEITEILAKPQLTYRDLELIEELRDQLLRAAS
jgi:hypothetical protein